MGIEPTSEFQADRAMETLKERSGAWAEYPLSGRIRHLRTLLRRTGELGPEIVAAAGEAKGVDDRFSGEDWVGGVAIQARAIRALLETLEAIERTGRVPIPADDVSVRDDGRVVLRVMPADRWDRLLFMGWRAETWLDREVTLDNLDDHLGSFYTKQPPEPGVAVVLGAGNVASIAPLDAVHKLFVDGKTVAVKFNPVNDYNGPFFERIFSDLIDEGFVRAVYGGGEIGTHIVRHPLADEVHLTGSQSTHDAIVFGTGRRRKKPILDKPITSELGNVSPVIVVPGEWSDSDIEFQAEHIATQIKQNDGFNCIAAKVLVMATGWEQKEQFLDAIRAVLGRLPDRPAYYPGAVERWERFAASHDDVEFIGAIGDGMVPATLLVGIDPGADHTAFDEESFCAVTAITELEATDAADFLARAVRFSNERLTGTLNATILVDPQTAESIESDLDDAIVGLEFGSIGVNIWGGASYALGTTAWGGFPGRDLSDVGSGIGFVHNGRLIDKPHKSVVWAPFRAFPKPPWFITHRNTNLAMRRFAEFEVDPGWVTAARMALASLRG